MAVGFLSMGVDVKTHSTCPSDAMVLASGVRATARGGASGSVTLRDVLVVHVADQYAIVLVRRATARARSGQPFGIEAVVFFRRVREPSFYRGFFEPSLPSVLRGGIAWSRGLADNSSGPRKPWMLTLETCSPRENRPGLVRECTGANNLIPATSVVYGLRCRAGSYSSSCFHIANAIAAI
jgi:hypothetical protein